MPRSRRLTIFILFTLLTLLAADVLFAAPLIQNPNPYFTEDLNSWKTKGPVVWADDPTQPVNDGVAVLPDVEQTTAVWQTLTPVPLGLPATYYLEMWAYTKGLTDNTAYAGLIINYKNGTQTKVYEAFPGYAGKQTLAYYPPQSVYLSDQVETVILGAINFGKKGDGVVGMDVIDFSNQP